MSLVIAFIGANGAVMAGDTRSITFQGDPVMREVLENELYEGRIVSDEQLEVRAHQLGIAITIRDGRSKVSERDGVLVGEVSSVEHGIVRKRRVYAAAGSYAIVDFEGSHATAMKTGKGSTFVVLGNAITKRIAHECIREHWKNGSFHDAVRIIMLALGRASQKTASVSSQSVLIQTRTKVDISTAVERDVSPDSPR